MSKDEQLYEDVGDIKECLIGNPLKNQKGLVATVNDIDARVNNIDTRLMKLENKMHRRKKTPKVVVAFLKFFGVS